MNYTEKFINSAENQKIIKVGKISDTKLFFDEANKVLEDAIDNSDILKPKFENYKIKRECISTASITEKFNNKTFKRPVIDLVQQGGGMYGIALLGYTYVMEKIGIRFYSHGGTSAGAINATLLASISEDIYKDKSIFFEKNENKQATKSELLTHIIINTSFSSFMERPGIIGKMQRILFKKFKSLKLIFGLLFVSSLIGIYAFFGIIFRTYNGLNNFELRFYDFVIGSINIFALIILFYILLIKLLGSKYGINTGNVFFNWSNNILVLLKIHNTNDLENRMKEVEVNGLSKKAKLKGPRLVLITSNLTHNRIVKFPEKAYDYWENYKNVKPAAYLRATMSLPFIFKAFIPHENHFYNKELKNRVIKEARFVDGGMLSNFPIREFHRTDNKSPLFPTFGVLLSKIDKNEDFSLKKITLLEYIRTFFKTFRNFYDADFIFSNDEIKNRVVLVNTLVKKDKPKGKHYNWLDFWMDNKTQKELFLRGVAAAIDQLEQFDWNEYLKVREGVIKSKTSEMI